MIIIVSFGRIKPKQKHTNNGKQGFKTNMERIFGENNYQTMLRKEFESVNPVENLTQFFGGFEENSPKNRYKNILPYDTTRVVLHGTESNYINASYIRGVNGDRTYIATQCPKKGTVGDFWLMVYQENVELIVCLASKTEGPKKFHQYWPEKNAETTFEDMSISIRYEIEYIDYSVVLVALSKNRAQKYVKIVNYTSWPDHGTPIRPISFCNFLRYCQSEESKRPIIVHCSAGIGRTGCFIMCDHLTRTNSQTNEIVQYLKVIRSCRPLLVSTIAQYKFVHLIVDEFKHGINTVITKDILRRCEIRNYQHEKFSERFQIMYSIFPQSDNQFGGNVINGIHKYFTINLDAASSTEIWELVENEDIEVIVVLQKSKFEPFWPKCHEMTSVGNSFVSTNHVKNHTDFRIHSILNVQTNRALKLYEYKNWKSDDLSPKNANTFARFFTKINIDKSDTLPIMVCCSDGFTASGIFIALNLLMEKFKLENIIDMYWAVHSMKMQNKLFLQELAHQQAIYDILLNIINQTSES